jgi:hypothetical protein
MLYGRSGNVQGVQDVQGKINLISYGVLRVSVQGVQGAVQGENYDLEHLIPLEPQRFFGFCSRCSR